MEICSCKRMLICSYLYHNIMIRCYANACLKTCIISLVDRPWQSPAFISLWRRSLPAVISLGVAAAAFVLVLSVLFIIPPLPFSLVHFA